MYPQPFLAEGDQGLGPIHGSAIPETELEIYWDMLGDSRNGGSIRKTEYQDVPGDSASLRELMMN